MCKPGERNTATKTCVVDGDTLWLNGVDYRMRDYDTPEPETAICGGAAEVELAHRASARFLELLNGNAWTIETYGQDSTGRRTLATIRIDGRDIGDILIGERLARHWPDGTEWWCSP
jgi:endonuclease YncB( thermonuclease family)